VEPHVKERIVGAAILVALGVWLIPWVLDGPEQAAETAPAVSDEILPAAVDAAPIRTETVELDPVPLASGRDGRAPAVEGRELDSQGEGLAGAERSADPATGEVADAGESPGLAEAATRSASARPQAQVASRREGWTVQLGAFGDVANANQLASRISTFGYSAYVSEFRSGGETMHRVRVGGFASENEADAAASSLSAHGFPGRVISPE